MWERTVMGFSVRTAETVKATPPYYYILGLSYHILTNGNG